MSVQIQRQDTRLIRRAVLMRTPSTKTSMGTDTLENTRLILMMQQVFGLMKQEMPSLSMALSGSTKTVMVLATTLLETMQTFARRSLEPRTLTHSRLVVRTTVMVGQTIGVAINSPEMRRSGMTLTVMATETIGELKLGMIREIPRCPGNF